MSEKSSFTTLFQHYSPLIFLITPLFLVTVLADILGNSLFERIVTVLFINLILVLGLQIFMGNSGILSFAHIGFMGIGAYASVLFSMTPQAKAIVKSLPCTCGGGQPHGSFSWSTTSCVLPCCNMTRWPGCTRYRLPSSTLVTST